MRPHFDKNDTFETLASKDQDALDIASHMKKRHPRLFRMPFSQLSAEDLFTVITEDVGLAYFVPLAVEVPIPSDT